MGGLCSALCLEVVDRPLILVACFAQFLNMLLGDVVLALRSSFKQLETRCLAVPEFPFAALFLSLKILDKVHGLCGRTNQRVCHSGACRPRRVRCATVAGKSSAWPKQNGRPQGGAMCERSHTADLQDEGYVRVISCTALCAASIASCAYAIQAASEPAM